MERLTGNLIGLDYGDKTVGVAFCEKNVTVAVPLTIIRRERKNKLRQTLAAIEDICKERSADGIILGYPLHYDGSEGVRCEETKAFAESVRRRVALPVVLWDERLTSVAAEEAMDEAGLSPAEQKEHVDALAAVLILQDYINDRRRTD